MFGAPAFVPLRLLHVDKSFGDLLEGCAVALLADHGARVAVALGHGIDPLPNQATQLHSPVASLVNRQEIDGA